jgi:hypothetical protein
MANEVTTSESKLDMARVQRWAQLLDNDAQARDFMRQHLAGGELSQLTQLQLKQQRLELALKHGIPAQLAEIHLTAEDPTLLEAQAESLARLVAERGSADPPGGLIVKGGPEGPRSVSPLPAYEAVPVNREEWLQQQFVQLYEH